MIGGYTYILLCEGDRFYTGSTIDLESRMKDHFNGRGSNFTKKHPPIHLVYLEQFDRITEAFYREKQIQGWTRVKKKALIKGEYERLKELSLAYRDIVKDDP